MSETPTFHIGICMAGAVSAGAYTAGVIDFLLEALEDWEQRKLRGENVPRHNVVIDVVSGASAGGMTSIIAATAAQQEVVPVQRVKEHTLESRPENVFYHSWVDLDEGDVLQHLLDPADLYERGLVSALNSTFIKNIARRSLGNLAHLNRPKPYFSQDLRAFVTLSNLNGTSYAVKFIGESHQNYYVTNHHDYGCFRMVEDETEYKDDGWMPLNFRKNINTALAEACAIATGAFPIALEHQKIQRDERYLQDHPWFKNAVTFHTEPNSPEGIVVTSNVAVGDKADAFSIGPSAEIFSKPKSMPRFEHNAR